ncbi:hypothetical protein [Comamonas sp. JC664]|uniref:hypothetical protein n=1 Tax=Comamonas sp. JC664 TaxID=2801917 RepID=UPI0019203049|nr:hypothetical protein [Comamonas sp. JC664]MBL0694927.1 hypothetical protein [Comamonas sp. JC664]GHG95310.1 hypothetical protein GCM10012319_59050 [Comamonas sp. KCTC 72670]
METTLASETPGRRPWRTLALAALPVALLPWGLRSYRARRRARRPAPLRSAVGLGLVSLAILRLAGDSRLKSRLPTRWRQRLPTFDAFLPEEFTASVASGH